MDETRRKLLNQIGPLTYQERLADAVRSMRANVIVETGVYNGVSTVLLLEAMWPAALLHSCDPTYSSQYAAEIQIKTAHRCDTIDFSRWRFYPERSRTALPAIDGPWDVFLHDSDHREFNMSWELDYAWERLRVGGLLVCDDYRWPKHSPHGAFDAFCKKHQIVEYVTHSTAAFIVKT
jgi:predicted O-methyltransferase YrrM